MSTYPTSEEAAAATVSYRPADARRVPHACPVCGGPKKWASSAMCQPCRNATFRRPAAFCKCGRKMERGAKTCRPCYKARPTRGRYDTHRRPRAYANGREVVTPSNYRRVREGFTPAELSEYGRLISRRDCPDVSRAQIEFEAVECVVSGLEF